MPGWFDIANLSGLTDPTQDDEKGLLASVSAIDALIQAEVAAGIPEDRIVLGGFSQGGAVAILTALTSKRKLAGVAALSTWVPLSHKVPQVGEGGGQIVLIGIDGRCYSERHADILGTWKGRSDCWLYM